MELLAGIETAIQGIQVVFQSEDSNALEFLLFLIAIFVGGLYLIYKGATDWRLKRLVENTATENVRSVAVGRTELEGTARRHETVLDPPLVEQDSVYVEWEAERREKHRDDDGNVHYTWETTAEGARAVPFELEDDTGRILVRADCDDPEFDIRKDGHSRTETYHKGVQPDGAVREYIQQFRAREENQEQTDGVLDSVTDTVTDLFEEEYPLGDTSHRRRYTQTVFPVGVTTYVFGDARSTDVTSMDAGQADLLEIRRDESADEFLIADGTEETVTERYSGGKFKVILGLAASALALWAILSGVWANF